MEVLVSLVPHPRSNDESLRQFVLHRDTPSMQVGRSSKTCRKASQPALNNASFDCPIMSRQHARFRGSTVSRAVTIIDLRSTHGTYLDGGRIPQDTEVNLNRGQVITFGSRVVNGTTTYPPKSFVINFEWRPRTVPAIPSRPPNTFSIPVDDDEDVEEISPVARREPSIQVLESNVRTTYSVPSDVDTESESEAENDEDVLVVSSSSPELADKPASTNTETSDEKASQAEADVQQVSQPEIYSPSQTNSALLKPNGSPDPENGIKGASRTDPINLEGENLDMESESDEEGPEILPIPAVRKRPAISDLLNDRPSQPSMGESKPFSYKAPETLYHCGPYDLNTTYSNNSTGSSLVEMDENILRRTHASYYHAYDVHGEAPAPSLPNLALERATAYSQPMSMDSNNLLPPIVSRAHQCGSAPGDESRTSYLPSVGAMPEYSPNVQATSLSNTDASSSVILDQSYPETHSWNLSEDHVNSVPAPSSCAKTTVTDDEQITRPDISNLVHAYPREASISLKRKADEISGGDDSMKSAEADHASMVEKDQLSLHDAQPRDLASAAEAETLISQVESGIPPASSTVLTPDSPAETEHDPAVCKKVKLSSGTSSPSSSAGPASTTVGIGRFVSGVCLGVLGAAVAFVATIPASVHEEALREL